MNKADIVAKLHALLSAREAALMAERTATLEARNSDTKSSMGDKHEVGRAMVQQELDQLEGRLLGIRNMLHELARVDHHHAASLVGFGSVVRTDQGIYFIAIPLGAVETPLGTCFAISSASPIGQALRGRRTGDVITWNGRAIQVLDVR
jgi:transcription elongation GreA/GreB family factor